MAAYAVGNGPSILPGSHGVRSRLPSGLCSTLVFAAGCTPPNASYAQGVLQPDPIAALIPSEEQLERSVELARWTTTQLGAADAGELRIDPFTGESLLPHSSRVYIARGEPAAYGTGSLENPLLVGDDGRLLGEMIRAAIQRKADDGEALLFIDNSIDTSLMHGRMQTAGLIDELRTLHIVAWDRRGIGAGVLPVIDAFRPVASVLVPGASFKPISPGSNIYRAPVAALDERPVLFRIGPATQHVHRDGFLFEVSPEEIGTAFPSESVFAYDGPDLLVRLRNDTDPNSADLRATVEADNFLRIRADRVYIRGLRVSGFGSSADTPDSYNIFIDAGLDKLAVLRDVRTDFSSKHTKGMAGGPLVPGSSRFTTIDCEYGFGYDEGAGYTASVAFSLWGGQSKTEIRPVYVGGCTGQRSVAQASFLHVGPQGFSRARIAVNASIDSGASSLSFGNHADRDPDNAPYAVWFGTTLGAGQTEPTAVSNPWLGQRLAYSEVDVVYPTTVPRSFQAVTRLNSSRPTDLFRSVMRLRGAMSPGASNERRWLVSVGNDYARTRADVSLRESVFDVSALGDGNEITFFIGENRLRPAVGVTKPIRIRDSVIRLSRGFRWMDGIDNDDPDFNELTDFSGSVFVGDALPAQMPRGARRVDEAQWASIDPAWLPDALATAWLVDQAGLNTATAAIATAVVGEDKVYVHPITHLEAGTCLVAVSMIPPKSSADQASLVNGLVGGVSPSRGGDIALPLGADAHDIYLLAIHPASALVRAAVLVRPATAACAVDLNADGTVNLEDLYFQTEAPVDVNGDGQVDETDAACLRDHLRRDELDRMNASRF